MLVIPARSAQWGNTPWLFNVVAQAGQGTKLCQPHLGSVCLAHLRVLRTPAPPGAGLPGSSGNLRKPLRLDGAMRSTGQPEGGLSHRPAFLLLNSASAFLLDNPNLCWRQDWDIAADGYRKNQTQDASWGVTPPGSHAAWFTPAQECLQPPSRAPGQLWPQAWGLMTLYTAHSITSILEGESRTLKLTLLCDLIFHLLLECS